jgi:hypothetical protein
VTAPRCIGSFVGFALILFGAMRAPRATPETKIWTSDRVRAFVLRVESEMDKLIDEQVAGRNPHLDGTCVGYVIDHAIKKSVALPRVAGMITGKVLACYVASYLGCDAGAWIASSEGLSLVVKRKPFTLSKVTILEQTPDRVVADVVEADLGVLQKGVRVDRFTLRPLMADEVGELGTTGKSRYTITRGKDGTWRISDRKPSFEWLCESTPEDVPQVN